YSSWMRLLSTGMHHHVDRRHARWQHHPHRHDLPASQEHDQGHQHWEMALLKQVVMIDQIALVGEHRKPRYRPGCGHQNPGPEDRCPLAWLGIVLHIGDLRDAHRTPPFLGTFGYASKWKSP